MAAKARRCPTLGGGSQDVELVLRVKLQGLRCMDLGVFEFVLQSVGSTKKCTVQFTIQHALYWVVIFLHLMAFSNRKWTHF